MKIDQSSTTRGGLHVDRKPDFRRLLQLVCLVGTGLIAIALGAAAQSYGLPDLQGSWLAPNEHAGRLATEPVRVEIRGIGTFHVDPTGIDTLRPDVFQQGHISIFDLLVKLDAEGAIDLAYHYDESMAAHVIDSIDGKDRWWYEAHYSKGWFERSVHRIDLYPVKNEMNIRLAQERQSRIDSIHATFAEDVARLAANDGVVIVPSVSLAGRAASSWRSRMSS